jgi:pimeloyl-ACP methyl ester carboxylesterase
MNKPQAYPPKRRPRRRFIEIGGVDYCVTEWGDKASPLLVYLHGFGDCASTFQFVVDELADDWFVVAPDWRGFGGTVTEARTFWFPDYLADLDRLLEIYSPGAPVRLVGHSMGGNIASLYAGSMPERVGAFVNLEGFGLPDVPPADAPARYRDWLLRLREDPVVSRRSGFDELAEKIRARNPAMSEAQAEFVACCWAEEDDDGSVRLHFEPAHKLPNPVLYRRAEAEACWRRITSPVLLVAGRRSEFGSPEDLPFPDPCVTWIENAGHMLHLEQPAALAQAIEEFFHGNAPNL